MKKLNQLLAAALLAAMTASAHAAPVLKAGDRVVFYGDSITEQRAYTRYVQQYIQCRYPEMKIKFFNAGWGGDTSPGGLRRLERDVLALNPTVVTLFFGMNDGGYRTMDANVTKNFKDGTEGIIKALQAKGVRVVVYTPGAVDYDRQKRLGDVKYNDNLEDLGKAALDLAKQYNLPSADVIHPMITFQNAQKVKSPAFTMIPDSVHPDNKGHLFMAQEMLKGLGAEPMPAVGSVDVKAGTGDGLRVVSNSAAQVVLETTRPVNMPFWVEGSSLGVARDSGFLNVAGGKLTVKGLAPGAFKVNINGTDFGKISTDDLTAGTGITGEKFPAAQRLHDLIARKENSYFTAWREVRLPLADVPGSQQIVDGLMAADEGYQTVIHNLAKPLDKLTITLTAAPEGANFAEGKRYVCSDENKYNWGMGGLTNGSWEANDKNCFATGDAPDFPKTVTIDLEKTQRLGSVTFGVPQFGSTKNVKISLSADGQTFKEVGGYQFSQRKEERTTVAFAASEARYVRLTYVDYHADAVGYTPTFGFTTEVEVYAPGK